MKYNICIVICTCLLLITISVYTENQNVDNTEEVFGENYQLMISDFVGINIDVEVPFCPYKTTSDTIGDYIICNVESFNSICEHAIRYQDYSQLALTLEGCPAYLAYMLKNNQSDEYYMISINFDYDKFSDEEIMTFTSDIRKKIEDIAPNRFTTVYKSQDKKTTVYCDILPIPERKNVIGITSLRIEYHYDT